MSTKLTFLINKTLKPAKNIVLIGNSNEFDLKLAKNMPDFKFFIYIPSGKTWDYSRYVQTDNIVTFGNIAYTLFNDISIMIGSHSLDTINFKNNFPYLPLVSVFFNEPVPEIPFFPQIEKRNYGNLCISPTQRISDAWQTNGKIIPEFDTKLLVKEIKGFYENSFNKRCV